MITLDQFIAKWNGKTIDFDGFYGAQCMDVYRQYVEEVLGCPQSPGVPGAKDVWITYLTQYFTRYDNTPTAIPNKGDIIIWNGNVGGGYGHIAVCTTADINQFTSFDQNWVSVPCHLQKHNYDYVLGWIRFKEAQDYKALYEQEKARADDLQSKIDKAKEALR